MQAVIAIFGIAWMGDTFINGNLAAITGPIEGIVKSMPWLFAIALFVMSILLYSQAATVRAIMPLGIALGISPMMLIALFPGCKRIFLYPQLSNNRGGHKLRPHRLNPYREMDSKPLVHDAGACGFHCGNRGRPAADPDILTPGNSKARAGFPANKTARALY